MGLYLKSFIGQSVLCFIVEVMWHQMWHQNRNSLYLKIIASYTIIYVPTFIQNNHKTCYKCIKTIIVTICHALQLRSSADKIKMIFYLPTYPTSYGRVGLGETNYLLRSTLHGRRIVMMPTVKSKGMQFSIVHLKGSCYGDMEKLPGWPNRLSLSADKPGTCTHM